MNAPQMRGGLALVWRAAKGLTAAWMALLVLQGLLPAAQVYLLRSTVNALAHSLGTQGSQTLLRDVGPYILALGVLTLAGQAAGSLMVWVRTAQGERVQDHVHDLIHTQAMKMDMAFFEDGESFDLLHRARVDAIAQPMALLENLGSMVQNGLTFLVMMGLLATYSKWLPILLLASAVPGIWVVARCVLLEHAWTVQNTPSERRARYFDSVLTERISAAEMRIFSLGDFHRRSFQAIRARLRQGRLALARNETQAELLAGTLAWAGGLGGMAMVLLQARVGRAGLGDLVLCYQAFLQGQKLLRTLMENAGRIYRSTLFLDNLFKFLNFRPRIVSGADRLPAPKPFRQGIQVEKVSFSYPGSDRPVLDGFDLDLPAGQTTAIVGPNGAGKSTLISLLCRFYDPISGRILLDGQDLRNYDLVSLRRGTTVLFQDPVRYSATAGENIAMGDLASEPGPGRIAEAAHAAGADGPISRLPNGYDSMLGKIFGGADLSGGEWQRLALARAFLRDASLVILDEPTSAMDSWAETEWLHRFRILTRDRTALIITHRFTTARYADRIHVMEGGRVLESGSHEDLVAAGGRYAESWLAQMREGAEVEKK